MYRQGIYHMPFTPKNYYFNENLDLYVQTIQ